MESITSWFLPASVPTPLNKLEELRFFVHDEEHLVKIDDVPPDTTLNSYLRKKANLTGTKNMCLEGGCGSCIVAVTLMDPVTDREVVMAVNSCLVPIYLCSGWKIHTPEKIGNEKQGYHPIQKAVVQFNGTQCGFCTSGMVMNMYALYESGKFTMKDVENSFGGNICRCTGYRPILSAFKSLATDASSELLGTFADIEDIPVCTKTQGICQRKCASPCSKQLQPHYYDFGKSKWVKVFSTNEIFDVMKENSDATVMLVGGNTATGVYKRTKDPDMFIDITSVKPLLEHTVNDDKLTLGANMTLTNAMALFYKLSKENKKFSYLEKLADHIDLIANVPVRNTGTLAGNLFTKHEHPEFPSDIYLILKTAGATLTIVGADHNEIIKDLTDFLSFSMKGKIILKITLPGYDESYKYESYKIMPRAQNAHALVNAGFLLKLDKDNKVEEARIVFGAINPSFNHAINAEKYLIGKDLFNDATLQGLFQALDGELTPDHVLPDPTPEFRKQLAIALCYKFILSIAPPGKISPQNKTGASKQIRPVSNGTQEYDTNKSLYPVTQPIAKIEALAQSTGQAKYIMDMPDLPDQLYAALVLAKASPNSVISKIDPAEALKLDGVVAFYDKNDIPGENNFTPAAGLDPFFTKTEEVFCSGVVKYFFQPLGVIIAKKQELAEKAADLVQVSYVEGKAKPLLTIREILAADAKDKITKEAAIEPKSKGTDVKHVIKGKFDVSSQYHYYMETQCCVVIPSEEGLDMYPSTQTMTLAQAAAAKFLKMPANKINVNVRRLGGAYGGKISRNSLVSCAAALAAHKLNKPVKISLPLITNMNAIGKRCPFSVDYEVGVNDKGAIQYLNASLYTDLGSEGGNENPILEIMFVFGNIYKKDTWGMTFYSTKSDTPSSTACRAPGTTEAMAAIESIMQHIASDLNLDPIQVRLENMDTPSEIPKYINDLIEWAEVTKRKAEIEQFNKDNRWVKRGMSVVPMFFPIFFFGYWHVHVAIYQSDGTVSVTHGGIEMGQGINTKVAQVCAYTLGIPLEQVCIKPSNVTISPNALSTGGSFTSEAICLATINACETLKERMKVVKDTLKDPTWQELVHQCYLKGVDLASSFLFQPTLPGLEKYMIYGATCAEVEVDLLTGLTQIKRVDLLEDTGNSLSPQIDIGQVEGAFIMGVGYWICEQIVYNEEGELLTNRTWTYKPPGVKDIPVDFRVKFPKNNPNPVGVFKSKATAEPPLCMAVAVPFAIKNAVETARIEADPKAEKWYPINGPSTVEDTFLHSLHDYKQYKL